MWPFVALTAIATAVLLLAEHRRFRGGIWAAKPLASMGFVLAALEAGALQSGYGHAVLVALLFSAAGDGLLIPERSPRAFRAGLGSFLLAHLCFAAAFVMNGVDPLGTAVACLLAIPPLFWVRRWLGPKLPAELRAPVAAYIAVISLMLVLAAGATAAGASPRLLVGALLFYASDLAVARNRFVAPGFSNKLWGLPLYFAGQLVLASSIA